MSYNGWKNYDTWNVSLWIHNDEPLYRAAVDFARSYKGRKHYKDFIESCDLDRQSTPDKVKYLSTKLDYRRLNEVINDLK